jgi:hypothetical protein
MLLFCPFGYQHPRIVTEPEIFFLKKDRHPTVNRPADFPYISPNISLNRQQPDASRHKNFYQLCSYNFSERSIIRKQSRLLQAFGTGNWKRHH